MDPIKLLLFGCLLASLAVSLQHDLYSVLGVSRTSSNAEIKKAYKKLAMQWHPDKTDSSDASDRFIKINQAYEVLSDPEKKQRYDRFGTVDDIREQSYQHHAHAHFDDFVNFIMNNLYQLFSFSHLVEILAAASLRNLKNTG